MSAVLALVLSTCATYSIAGVNTETEEVGGAGTSCVGRFSVYNIYGSAPGRGVVHAQAFFNAGARDRAIERLLAGRTPEEIVQEITGAAFDPDAARRQYAVLDVSGASARFTGTGASAYAGDLGGRSGNFVYAAQGNIITGRGVLERAGTAFEGGGCDLADRLMRALEAGAEGGEGDTRCTPGGIPSDGAFIEVDRPGEDAGGYLRLRVENSSPDNPITLLRTQFEVWRTAHPCPVLSDRDAATPSDSTDATIPTANDSGVVAETAPVPKDSCGCRSTGGASSVLVLFVVAVFAIRRDRRHQR
jgi:MYXO-CTERM domain-containing protein